MTWQTNVIIQQNIKGRKLIVYGAGDIAFNNFTKLKFPIEFFVTSFAKENEKFMDKPVYNWDSLQKQGEMKPSDYYIVILVNAQNTDISEKIQNAGFEKYEDFVYYAQKLYPFDIIFNNIKVGRHTG
ncbi:MAG: hypothetical protein LBM93_11195 [Oscillospiraceae bacterium]|jgi:hypothetical protein|nr:hypothetical protein [Oscillospiraceae bacterium]